MGVSKNRGTPKSSILIGFSIIFTIHFGVPLFLETPIWQNTCDDSWGQKNRLIAASSSGSWATWKVCRDVQPKTEFESPFYTNMGCGQNLWLSNREVAKLVSPLFVFNGFMIIDMARFSVSFFVCESPRFCANAWSVGDMYSKIEGTSHSQV